MGRSPGWRKSSCVDDCYILHMNVQIDKLRVSAAIKRLSKDYYQHEIAKKLKMSQAEVSLLLNKQKDALRDKRLDLIAKVCDVPAYDLLAPPMRKLVAKYGTPF